MLIFIHIELHLYSKISVINAVVLNSVFYITVFCYSLKGKIPKKSKSTNDDFLCLSLKSKPIFNTDDWEKRKVHRKDVPFFILLL